MKIGMKRFMNESNESISYEDGLLAGAQCAERTPKVVLRRARIMVELEKS